MSSFDWINGDYITILFFFGSIDWAYAFYSSNDIDINIELFYSLYSIPLIYLFQTKEKKSVINFPYGLVVKTFNKE